MINRANRGDDLAPARLKLLRLGKLEPNAKRPRAVRFGDLRHLHDPGLVVAEEFVPFLGALEVDLAAPEKFRAPIGDVRDEHDLKPALARPIERHGDMAIIVAVAKPDVAVIFNLGVRVNRDAVHA